MDLFLVPYSRVLRYRCIKRGQLIAEGYTEHSPHPWKLEWYWVVVCSHTRFLCILHVTNVEGIPLANLVRKNMLIEAWNGSIYRGHGVSLWWICLSTPFIYTLFYIFSYISHTDHTHYLPCVCYLLFIICILCVFYDSIHALIVYVLFRAITYIIRVYLLSIKVYKVLCHCRDQSLEGWRASGTGGACIWGTRRKLHQRLTPCPL